MYQIIYGDTILARGNTPAKCIDQLKKIKISLILIEGSWRVEVYNPTWADKHFTFPTSFRADFTRAEILSYLAVDICRLCGYKVERLG